MTERLAIEVYTTRQYTPGWRSYERSIDVPGFAKMTKPVKLIQAEPEIELGRDGSYRFRCDVTLPPAMYADLKKLHKALTRSPYQDPPSFRRWLCGVIGEQFDVGCRCQHDCCGHVFGSGFARPTRKKRTYVVTFDRALNL